MAEFTPLDFTIRILDLVVDTVDILNFAEFVAKSTTISFSTVPSSSSLVTGQSFSLTLL